MKEFKTVDLKQYFNHQLIYQKLSFSENEEFGLDNTCILKADLKIKKKEVFNDVSFQFDFNGPDNVVCCNQMIRIDECAKKLHLIAFSCWGDTNEYIKVVYDNEEEDLVKVPFLDAAHRSIKDFQNWLLYGENVETVKGSMTVGRAEMVIYFHHSEVELRGRVIKELILPDNMFVHIFAMTLEK